MNPEAIVSDVSAYLLSFLGQWGPAVYLCYKVGLAKANTLVYEAGEWLLFLSYPLTLHSALCPLTSVTSVTPELTSFCHLALLWDSLVSLPGIKWTFHSNMYS